MIKCPQCGGDKLKKDGVTHQRGSPTGHQRYACLNSACKPGGKAWRGSAPLGLDVAKRKGIDEKLVEALHQRLLTSKRIVVTSAQNATPVFTPGWKSLLSYCKRRRAELVVIGYRYKNPTSQWTEKNEADDWWDKRLAPYLYDRRIDLDPHIMILGDIMTQPTATRPLSGYETISGKKSAIIGHPKLELTTIPTPQSRLPKILTTTGAITVRNYVDAKAGKKGEFHHTFGAAVVELEGGRFHLRQINMMRDGSFIDLDTEYDGDKIESGIPLEALNMGDTHEEFISPDVVHGTFGPGGIVPTLKPKKLFWHDLHDFYSRNHHHRGDPFIGIAKQRAGVEDVEQSLRKTFAFLDKHTPVGVTSIIVKSNHPNALARWIKEADWKSDPVNASFYLRSALAMTEAAKMTAIGADTIDPFAHWGKQWLKSRARVVFLSTGESYMVKGIENSFHGHEGNNGARGSLRQFGKIGVKTISGHGHSEGIEDGAFRNGTSTYLRMGYTGGGPSSWMNAHTVIYRNGKRSLYNVIDGHWHG